MYQGLKQRKTSDNFVVFLWQIPYVVLQLGLHNGGIMHIKENSPTDRGA
jgi:hypothetical protein